MGRLTALKVRALTEPGRYGDGDGLWLQVRDAKKRSWLFRYTRQGRARQMGLGPAANEAGRGVTLAEAREKALEARALIRAGKDPLVIRQQEEEAARAASADTTFEGVAELFVKAHEASWRNAKHRAQWRSTLDAYAYPVFGKRRVAEIGTGDITKALEPIWRSKPETASRLRGRIEQVLDYAQARGWRVGDNPARWRGHLANLLPARSKVAAVQHHPALPWADVGAFLRALRQESGTAPRALELLILTACRSNEALGARWGEFDLAGKVWTVPAARMKAGRVHRVPLSDAAAALLKGLTLDRSPGAFVFEGRKSGKPLSDMALTMVVRRLNEGETPAWRDGTTGEPITVHGFRSTFRDWAAERTSFAREIAEAALAHTLSDKTEAAYRRSDLFDKRAKLMQVWATFCSQPSVAGTVTLLARRLP